MKLSKSILSILFCAILLNIAFGQQTAKVKFNDIVAEFLEEGSIIMKQQDVAAMPASSKKEKKRKLKAQDERDYFIGKFKMPSSFTDFSIVPKFQYDKIPFSSLGSVIFNRDALPISVDSLNNKRLPYLLVASDLSQLALDDPTDNSYELHINLLSYMNWVLDGSADTNYSGIISAKTKVALQKTFQDKNSLSVAYGYFQNRLATIFKEVHKTQRIVDNNNFAPLFDAWVQHSVSNLSNKYIIDGFNALVVEKSSNSLFLGNSSIDAVSELNLSIPFINLKNNLQYNWKSEKEMKNSIKTLSVYIDGEPNFVKIPSPDEIYKTWEYVTSSQNNEVVYEDGKLLTISDFLNDEPVVKVLFGPLPAPEYKSDLAVRLSATDTLSRRYLLEPRIQDFNRSSEDIEENLQKGLYYIPIILRLNREALRTDARVNQNIVINSAIEVYYKKKCVINNQEKFLSIIYPLYINLNTGPGIKVDIANVAMDEQEINQNWDISLLTTELVEKVALTNLDFELPELDKYEEELVQKSRIVKDAQNPLKWKLSTSGPILKGDNNYGDNIKTSINFTMNRTANSLPVIRGAKAFMPIKYKEVPVDSTTIVRVNIDDLKTFIADSIKLDDGRVANEILQSPTTSDSLKIKTYDELIEKGVIKNENKVFKLFGIKSIHRVIKN